MNTYNMDKMYENYSSEIERMQKCIDELLQENNQLKEELKYTVPIVEHNKIVSKKLKENQKYKEVIDKAIEWIYIVQQNKDNKHLEPIISTNELDELLDILKESGE